MDKQNLKIPWYKKIFKSSRTTEFLDIVQIKFTYHFTGKESIVRVAVYKEFDIETGEIYSLYAYKDGYKINFDVGAYVKGHGFILK